MNLPPAFLPSGARWRLLVPALWAVVACYMAFAAWKLASGYADAARGAPPLYTDFTPTYAASMLVRAIPAEYVYLQRAMVEAGREAARAKYGEITDEQARGVGFAPFMYPPTFILVIAPLAYLPYLLSWFAWLLTTAIPYVATMRRILPAPFAWPFALAAPPVFYNVMYGQTGFLTAGLIGFGLVLLRSSPVWAGIFIGLASVKPHFGVLVPFALAAGGYWRTIAAAAVTVIVSIVLSVAVFGDDPWFAFIGTSLFHLEGFSVGAFALPAMVTAWSSARMAGMSATQAWAVQYAMSALMVAIVAGVWWRGRKHPQSHGLQAAVLCLATPLALPLVFLYDLALIVPAAAWLWADMRRHGAKREEYWILAAGLVALLGVKEFAKLASFQAGPWILSVLLGLTLSRFLVAVQRKA